MNSTTNGVSLQSNCSIFGEFFEVLDGFHSDVYLVNHIVACVVNVIIQIATVSLNGITVFTFWRSSRLKEKVAFYLIMVQSLLDLGVGIVAGSVVTSFIASEIRGRASCVCYYLIGRMILLSTILSTCISSVMCIERYMGVVHPIVHRNKVTKKLLSKCIACISVLCVIMLGVSFYKKLIFLMFSRAVIMICVLIAACTHIRIVFAVILSRKGAYGETGPNPLSNPSQQNVKRRQFLKELKLSKACFLVVVCYIVCYIPISFLGGFIVLRHYYDQAVYRTWAVTFVMLESSLNSVIFVWKNRVLRHEVKMVLRSAHNSSKNYRKDD